MTIHENLNLQSWLEIGYKIINGVDNVYCFAIECNCKENYLELREKLTKFLNSIEEFPKNK